jgi:hypothetical protein
MPKSAFEDGPRVTCGARPAGAFDRARTTGGVNKSWSHTTCNAASLDHYEAALECEWVFIYLLLNRHLDIHRRANQSFARKSRHHLKLDSAEQTDRCHILPSFPVATASISISSKGEKTVHDEREGKAPSTQAGEFVREEMHHVREGKHGARSTKQAIAIGLSKARAGVRLKPPARGKAKAKTRQSAARAYAKGRTRKRTRPSAKRSRAILACLSGKAALLHRARAWRGKHGAPRGFAEQPPVTALD